MNDRKNKIKLSTLLFLVVVLIILVTLLQIKYRFLHALKLTENKDLIQVWSSIISSILLTIGAVFTYFKFFKGRTFVERLILNATINVINTETPWFLHTLDIELQNCGNIGIKDPVISVSANLLGNKSESLEIANESICKLNDSTEKMYMIDSLETDSKHCTAYIRKDFWAVQYKIKVETAKNHWIREITIENKEGKFYKTK